MMNKFRISEIKRAITAMKEVKDFNDNAFFGFTYDPLRGREGGIEVQFMQGDVMVSLETKLNQEAEEL